MSRKQSGSIVRATKLKDKHEFCETAARNSPSGEAHRKMLGELKLFESFQHLVEAGSEFRALFQACRQTFPRQSDLSIDLVSR